MVLSSDVSFPVALIVEGGITEATREGFGTSVNVRMSNSVWPRSRYFSTNSTCIRSDAILARLLGYHLQSNQKVKCGKTKKNVVGDISKNEVNMQWEV